MFKKSLLLFVGVLLVVALALLAYFVCNLNEPSKIISSERVRTSMPEQIYVEYVAYACGGSCPKLTEIFKNKDGKDVLSKKPLFIRYPDDIENPEDTKLGFSGNKFILTAYREIDMKQNKQHQNLLEFTNFIDVVSWEVETPYSFYGDKGSPREVIKKNAPVKQVSKTKKFD